MLTQTHLQFYQDNGYVAVSGLFSLEEVTHYRDHYMEQRQYPHPGDDTGIVTDGDDPIKRYPRMIKPHLWDELSLRWMLEPRINACLTGLLGHEPYAAQTMVYFKPPGARGQAAHQDQYYLRVKPGTCIAAWPRRLREQARRAGCLPTDARRGLPARSVRRRSAGRSRRRAGRPDGPSTAPAPW